MGCCPQSWRRRRSVYTPVHAHEQMTPMTSHKVPVQPAQPSPDPVRPQVQVRKLQRIELSHDVTHQTAIAFDASSGRVAVCNTDTNSVDVLNARTGTRMFRMGARGTDPGQFWSPSALAFDVTGRNTLLVGERNGGQRVQDMHLVTKLCTRSFHVPGGVSALDANRVAIAVGGACADETDGSTVVVLCAHSFLPLHRLGVRSIRGWPVTACNSVALDVAGQTRVWVGESATSRVHTFGAFTLDGRRTEALPHEANITQATFVSPRCMIVADNLSAGLHVFRRASAADKLQLFTSVYAPQLQLPDVQCPVFIANSAVRPDILWVSDAAYTRSRCLTLHEFAVCVGSAH